MIKKNDNVRVLSGSDKGKKGKVLRVLRDEHKVIVEGINMKKRHLRKRGSSQPGQIIEIAAPLHISNVCLVDAPAKKAKVSKKTA